LADGGEEGGGRDAIFEGDEVESAEYHFSFSPSFVMRLLF
jgi:hypothetical protein